MLLLGEKSVAELNLDAQSRIEKLAKELECTKKQLKMADEEADTIWAERVHSERRLRDIIEQGDGELHK